MFKNIVTKIKKNNLSLNENKITKKSQLKSSIFKKAESFIEENIFYDLGPKNNVDEDKIYYNKFMTAIENNNKMIAFTGAYGIGKTSIINSILKRLKNKEIRISLGNYKFNSSKEEPSTCQNAGMEIDASEIETKIVQQIIYTTDEKDLPNSKFKRIKYITLRQKISIIATIFIIIAIINTLIPSTFQFMYLTPYNNINNIISNIPYIELGTDIINIISGIPLLLFTFFYISVLYKITLKLVCKLNISIFRYKDLELKVEPNDDISVFNKYLDEIVYFFRKTKHNIMVIEDLDRYGNISLEIFRKLKELNFLLNANKSIKKNGGVIFIYAVRDDLFSNCKNRVKFFDCIIPVVSKFSNQNTKQYIDDLYNQFVDKYKIVIDESLRRIISFYINDRRLLLNIFMEMKMYIDNLKKNTEINYNELFSIVCYKNLNPIDFDKRLYLQGDLYNLFNSKNILIKLVNKELNEKNDKLLIERENALDNRKVNSTDIKKSFVLSALQTISINTRLDTIQITIDNIQYTINEFVNNNINIEVLKNNNIMIKSNGYGQRIIDKGIQNNLISKLKLLEYDIDKQNIEIKKNNMEIEGNLHKTIEEILSIDYIRDLIIDKEIKGIFKNDLLISLVKNGFIKENFEKSISYFKEGDLLYQDNSFIISVDTNNKKDFGYKLVKIEEIIKVLEIKSFSKESILNFDLVDFLLKNTFKSNIKLEKVLEQFQDLNSYKLNFLIEYLGQNLANFNKLLEFIVSDVLVDYIIENIENFEVLDKIIKCIIENMSITTKELSTDALKEYIENDTNILNSLELTEITKKNLIDLELDIVNYENIELKIINLFYESNQYNSNKSFYNRLLKVNKINNIKNDEKILDILFENEKFMAFKDKSISTENFYELYINCEKFNSSERNIILALNSNKLDIEVKKVIILKETEKIKDLRMINDNDVMLQIIESDKYLYTMTNIVNCYDRTGNVNSTILNMLKSINQDYAYIKSQNFDKFENDLLYSDGDAKIPYNKIAEGFSYCITSFDESRAINLVLLVELIRLNKVELNIQTFTFLEKNCFPQLLDLVNNNVNDLITIKNDIDISVEIINSILIGNANIIQKLQFINTANINELSEEAIAIIVKEIIKSSIVLDDILLEVIFSKINENDKIEFFIYLHSQNEENIKYLSRINGKTAKIRDGKTTSQTFDKKYAKLLRYLDEKNFINKVEEQQNGKLNISYKKKKY